MKLKSKLLIFFMLLFLFPAIIGTVMYFMIHKEFMDLYQTDLRTALKMASHFIEDKKLLVENTALYLGKESRSAVGLKKNMLDDVQTTIDEKLTVTSRIGITYIAIIDSSGKRVCQTMSKGNEMELPIDPADLRNAQNGFSACKFTAIDTHLYLIGYAPLILADEILGVVICASHIDESFSTMISALTDQTVYAYVGGDFIPVNGESQLKKYSHVAQQVLAAGQMQSIRSYVGGVLHSLIFYPLFNDYNDALAVLCIEMPMNNMLHADRCFTYGMLAFLCSFLILLVIFFMIADKYFLRPVSQLEQAALLVAEGNFDVNLPEHHNDELGQLTESFSTMVENLNLTQEELHDINRQLSDTNKQLEMYVLTVSHDLKSPIVVIKNFLQLLNDSFSGRTLQPQQRMFFTRIAKNLDKMLLLIKDITDYFKLGKFGYDLKPVNFKDIINAAVQRLEDQIEEKNARIILPDVLPEVTADKDRAVTLMVNLLSNALRFVKTDTPPKIEISFETIDGYYRFFVKDNGIGIDSEYKDRIFEIFYILGEIDVENSSGVGLSMVKKIVEDHGGTIYVDSEKGVGSTFVFTLPQC